jgi:enamine deaminase RidA (YjgF/YER057c/UK114 family)
MQLRLGGDPGAAGGCRFELAAPKRSPPAPQPMAERVINMPFVDDNLKRLEIILPAAPKPVAAYVPYVHANGLVFISGQLPSRDGKVIFTGSVPGAISVLTAKDAARLATINALAVLRDAANEDWNRVIRMVRLGVFVQSDPGFDQQPQIANGASDLLLAVFGDAGRHARAAVGASALPLNAAVEVELIAQLRPI